MKRLGPRLERLERAAKAAAVCALCGGHGRTSLRVEFEGSAPRPPQGCARCGRVGAVRRVVVHVPEEACA